VKQLALFIINAKQLKCKIWEYDEFKHTL
jgi:sRNA-binding regulator protein Hfq